VATANCQLGSQLGSRMLCTQENDVVALRQNVAPLQAENDYLRQRQRQQQQKQQDPQQRRMLHSRLNIRPQQEDYKCHISGQMEDVILFDHTMNTSMMSLTTGSITTASEDDDDDYAYDDTPTKE
jgi:hypothetical protein